MTAGRESIRALATVTLDATALDELGPETLDRLAELVEAKLTERRAGGEEAFLTPAAAAEIAGCTRKRCDGRSGRERLRSPGMLAPGRGFGGPRSRSGFHRGDGFAHSRRLLLACVWVVGGYLPGGCWATLCGSSTGACRMSVHRVPRPDGSVVGGFGGGTAAAVRVRGRERLTGRPMPSRSMTSCADSVGSVAWEGSPTAARRWTSTSPSRGLACTR
jgi:hypothetical protein